MVVVLVLMMKTDLTGDIMEVIDEIGEVTVTTVVLDLLRLVGNVTWVVEEATTTIEVVVEEEEYPLKIQSLPDAWECLAWVCTQVRRNYSMCLQNMDLLKKSKLSRMLRLVALVDSPLFTLKA